MYPKAIEIFNNATDANQSSFFDIQLCSSYPIYTSIAEFNEKEFGPVETEEDMSKILPESDDFRESIKRAREQLRTGTHYFSHEEVFGE